ncbi:GEVED domain-containing protein [Blastopirellula marina]|uniref:Uncharacterized protein n=1 Tax=Blastopirellula marina TaxID=124 RepID=A0A2S8G8W7_9BACT|nr:GEVED domain-containing protein [Blastopirellula marina]PQO40873.1 hypothetical protein C5Y98_04655 [Blastopirellula marina]PTL45755.1 hypothetical protein C5Y97_04655 [Blastopirellula marina]
MKRRGLNRQNKRRVNRTHLSYAEQLEDRRLLTANGSGDDDHLGQTFEFAPGVLSENTGEWAKFSTPLAMAAIEARSELDSGVEAANVQLANTELLYFQGMIAVDSVVAEGATSDGLISQLTSIGAIGTSAYGRLVSSWVPIDALSSLAQVTDMSFTSAVFRPVMDVGATTSQGVAALQADDALQTYGYDGTGVTVGILSDTFDSLGGYATDVNTGDLPADVNILADLFGGSDEGRAMAQLIYDVAPGASLAFYTAVAGGQAAFANGILALADAGADIIVDDVRLPDEPFFQDGVIAQAVDTVVASGIPYFASQGNYLDQSYESAFSSSQQNFGTTTEVMHDFDPGTGIDTMQSVSIPVGGQGFISLQWDEPSASVGGLGSTSDYNIYLVDGSGNVIASGIDNNIGNNASEVMVFFNDGGTNGTTTDYNIVITKVSGADAGVLKYVYRNGYSMVVNEYDTQGATGYGHSNAAGAAAVGAAYFADTPDFGTSPPVREDFSSLGGVPILFDTAGNRLATQELRQAPNFVAPDGTNTTFFGQQVNDGDNFPNFFGTSAAAPHAAAVGALMLQANPDLTPAEMYSIMQDTAIDMDAPGVDFWTGYGLIDALAAVGQAEATYDPGNPGGPGGGSSQPTDACGVPLPVGTVTFSGAIGGNLFASNHAILDGDTPGMAGYDNEVLDFLRGQGTQQEIAKSNYSIAVVGNGLVDWSFSNGSKAASGYERTDFYNINYLTASVFQELLEHNLIIILSGDGAVTDGMSSTEMALWATVEEDIAEAVNLRGLDLWVGASGGNNSYYDFLPTGALSTASFSTIDPLDGYQPSLTGQLLGITNTMVDSAAAYGYFDTYDDDLFDLEYRYSDEIVSVAGQALAFYDDEVIAAADYPETSSSTGLVGLAFQDLDMDGYQDSGEEGVAGARFFIDYNGDGIIGLCEPTVTSDALGRFVLQSGYSGHFQILPVPTAGIFVTSTDPVYIDLAGDGTATLSAPLSFGVIAGSDTGSNGGGSTPIAPGAYLGASPIADDGVIFTSGIHKGTNTVTIISSVTLRNTVMNAWIDLNKDGDWNDPGEQIFTNVVLQPGQHEYTFTIPTTIFDDSVLPEPARLAASVRFRVGPTLGIGPSANDAFGEIEDYKVYLSQGPDAGLTAKNDVFEYQEDTDGQFFNVLANDSSFYHRTLSIVPGSVTNISPVTDPPLDITVSPDGTRILFNAGGVSDLTENITFQYMVQDTAGNKETATVTLVAPIDPDATGTNGIGGSATESVFAFHNSKGPLGDVNNDGSLTGLDLLKVIKQMQNFGSRDLPEWSYQSETFSDYIDVNADGRFSYLDLLAMVNSMTNGTWNGEPLESEPTVAVDASSSLANTVVEVLAAPQIAEVAAPISKEQSASPTVDSSTLYIGWQSLASKSDVSSTDEVDQADTDLVVDEAFGDAGFDYVNAGEDDLLLSVDNGSEEFGSESSSVEDEIFGDEQWDEELLAF